jgi:hypothetical protein
MMPRPTIDLTPVAKFDRVAVTRGQSIVVNILRNDVDPEGPIPPSSVMITQQPTNGTVTVNADGTVTFKQDGSDLPFDSFRYKVRDLAGQLSNEAIALIDINAAPNQAPTAVSDTATVARGQSVVISVLANDSDPDGSLNPATVTITQNPTNGTATVNASGTITYVHNGTSTTNDTIQYTVRDNRGKVSNVATVSITITSSETVAVNDSATVARGSSVTINVAANDIAPTGTSLNLQSIVITQQPANGTLTNLNNGQFTYVHNGSNTLTDSFRYTIRSGTGVLSNEATVTITITSPNQAPVAVNDSTTVTRGGTVTIPVAANDSAPNGQLDLSTIQFATRPANGTVTANSDGTVRYVHNGSEEPFDTFSYTIRDRQGQVSNIATVAITITNVANVSPTAVDDSASVIRGGTVVINIAANDSDPENQLDLSSINIVDKGEFGDIVVNSDGTVTYRQIGELNDTDFFRYTIRDLQGAVSNEAIVTITVLPNANPIANEDATTVARGGTVVIRVAANDIDPEGQLDLTSIAISEQPTHGAVTVNANGTISYQNNGSEATSDQFSYTIRDLQGNVSESAVVSIAITEANDPPLANPDEAVVDVGQSVVINVAANDVDPEGQLDLGSIVITALPTNGTVMVNPDGTVKYTHNNTSTPTDVFRYQIRDDQGAVSNETEVTISINLINRAPVAKNDSGSVASSGSTTIEVLLNDSDPDGNIDPSSVTITSDPLHGSVTVNPDGTITYTHDGSFALSDSFRYTVRDSEGLESNEATVTIQISTEIIDPELPSRSFSGNPAPEPGDGKENGDYEFTPIATSSPAATAVLVTSRAKSEDSTFQKVDSSSADFLDYRDRFGQDLLV